MKTGIACFTIIFALFWQPSSSGQAIDQASGTPYNQAQYLELISAYVEKTVNIYDGNWSYTYLTNDKLDSETVTRRIDPARPFLQSDQLISVNGKPPEIERLARHEGRMQRRLSRREKSNRSIAEEERAREGREKERFLKLIIPQSLRLVNQTGDLHTLEFKGMEEDRKNIYKHLTGTLILDTGNEFIRELQVRVAEPFSPFLIMRINDGFFSLRFALNDDGIPVQTSATWQLDGHILYVKELDRDEELSWFDISKVSLPASH